MPKPARGSAGSTASASSASYVGNGLQDFLPSPVRCESPKGRAEIVINEDADPLTPSALCLAEEGTTKQLYGQSLLTVPEDDSLISEEVFDPEAALSDTPAQPSNKLRARTRRRSGLTRKFSRSGVAYVYTGPERAGDVSEEFLDQEPPVHVKERDLKAALAPPEELALFAYLEKYGYKTRHAYSWPAGSEKQIYWPKITLDQINGHEEKAGHTWYFLMCHLKVKGLAARHWCVQRRLSQLRRLLHDPIKQESGNHYDLYFEEARFASHGGLRGTTKTLQTWLTTWAAAINAAQVPPHLVALTLRFLEAPPLFGDEGEPLVPSSARSEQRRPPTPLTGRFNSANYLRNLAGSPERENSGAFGDAAALELRAAEESSTSAAQVPAAGVAPNSTSRASAWDAGDFAATGISRLSAWDAGDFAASGAAANTTSRVSAWDAADFAASGTAANTTSRVSAWDAADFAASGPSRGDEDDYIPALPQASGSLPYANGLPQATGAAPSFAASRPSRGYDEDYIPAPPPQASGSLPHANGLPQATGAAPSLAASRPSRDYDEDYIPAPPPPQASRSIPHANDSLNSGLLPQAIGVAPAPNSRASGFDADDFAVSPTRALSAAVPANPYRKFDDMDDMPIESEDTLPNLR